MNNIDTTARSAMKQALEALKLVNLEFVCANGSHHAKKDRHEWDEDCPITDRWRKAITALRVALASQGEALASEAIEKPAPVAKPHEQEPVQIESLVDIGATYEDIYADQKAELAKALAEQPAQQEPVAWGYIDEYGEVQKFENPSAHKRDAYSSFQLLYTSPPAQRTWVGLTDEEIDRLWSQSLADTESETWLPLREFARASEAKLKEKNCE